ncbi:MAG TPA: uroporphyrinogen-III C-methyltransferase, partial [Burkholderiaceae bacterium]|nr:uroporphyrinogen-III C-methyltransferase [Burkholderiaceae bacterium]
RPDDESLPPGAANAVAAAPAVPESAVAARRPAAGPGAGVAIAILVAAIVALGVALVRQGDRLGGEIAALRAQLAHAPDAAAAAAEPAGASEAPRDRVDALAQRLADLEARSPAAPAAAEAQGLHDEGVTLEVERLVTLASQELQITGSVPTALAALQAADARLARVSRPQAVELRRAIARDIEKLRAAPVVDVTGMAIRLDQLQQAVDGWPLMADPAQRPAPEAPRAAAAHPAAGPPATFGAQLRAWLAAEFGDLIRIREVTAPEGLLVDAQQQALVRDRLRLRLLGARFALIARDDRLFRADLGEAATLLTRYFDVRHAGVAAAQAQIKVLAATPVVVEAPTINDSVGALRALRSSGSR